MNQYPLVTIVGGSGFVGRHVVKLLASKGYRIRVLVRDTIAAEAKKAGVKTLVHISALGADQATDTNYGSTKFAGEQAVKTEFPNVTILRPSLIIGPEDGFFQRFGRMSMISPILPLIAGGKTRFQPVLVTDVAQAILSAISNPAARGKTFELAGPTAYSFRDLLKLMASITKRTPCLVSIPSSLAKLKGFFCELMPFAPMITRDQVKLLAHDTVATAGAPGFAALGLAPGPIESQLPTYLSRYTKE